MSLLWETVPSLETAVREVTTVWLLSISLWATPANMYNTSNIAISDSYGSIYSSLGQLAGDITLKVSLKTKRLKGSFRKDACCNTTRLLV